MKRFLGKCALLLAAVATILWLGGAAYKSTAAYQQLEEVGQVAAFAGVPERVRLAVVGSSHGMFMFPFFRGEEGDAFNFSLSAQTPRYDWMMLRQFAERIQPGAAVILTVSYFGPYWRESPELFNIKQPRYYYILDPENIVDVDLAKWYMQRFSPLLTTPVSQVVWAFVHGEAPAAAEEETGPLQLQEEAEEEAAGEAAGEDLGIPQLQAADLPGERERINRLHLEWIEDTYPEPEPVMWDAYHQMLELCRERGWNAVLLTPPYLAEYSACFPEGFYENYRGLLEGLSGEYNVPWLDYSHDPEFTGDLSLFLNIDHLNYAGAARFAPRFEADLRALGFDVELPTGLED